jgi:hypothetical protein
MSITEQNVRDARLGFSSADDYWAAELLGSLNKELPGTAFEWAKACVSINLAAAGDNRKNERELLASALSCDKPEELRHLSAKVEANQRDALSLALANLIVARTLDLVGRPERAIFFLTAVMRFLGTYCRSQHISPDELFRSLPLGPL